MFARLKTTRHFSAARYEAGEFAPPATTHRKAYWPPSLVRRGSDFSAAAARYKLKCSRPPYPAICPATAIIQKPEREFAAYTVTGTDKHVDTGIEGDQAKAHVRPRDSREGNFLYQSLVSATFAVAYIASRTVQFDTRLVGQLLEQLSSFRLPRPILDLLDFPDAPQVTHSRHIFRGSNTSTWGCYRAVPDWWVAGRGREGRELGRCSTCSCQEEQLGVQPGEKLI